MDKLNQYFQKEKDLMAYKIIFYFLIILFSSVSIGSFINSDFLNLAIGIAGIIILFIFHGISLKFNKYFIDVFLSMVNIFLFISMYLGSIKGFYPLLYWWDILAHVLSGVIFSILGFIIIFKSYDDLNLNNKKELFLSILFSISFGIAAGVFWEIYEFTLDTFFGLYMQGGGNFDTMKDLISNTIGAIPLLYFLDFIILLN